MIKSIFNGEKNRQIIFAKKAKQYFFFCMASIAIMLTGCTSDPCSDIVNIEKNISYDSRQEWMAAANEWVAKFKEIGVEKYNSCQNKVLRKKDIKVIKERIGNITDEEFSALNNQQ